jgi:COP9 signalosome complex subunit 7
LAVFAAAAAVNVARGKLQHTQERASSDSGLGKKGCKAGWEERAMPCSAESYGLLAKQATGKALVHLIQQAIDDPAVFTFERILSAPHIKALRSSDDTGDRQQLALLDIFSHGSYQDYKQKADPMPQLSAGATRKLRMLSLLDLCQQSVVAYSDIQRYLDLQETSQAEELVIEAIYASLLVGKLNSAQQTLTVQSCVGRDLRPNALPELEAKLTQWLDTCETMLDSLQAQSITIEEEARARMTSRLEHEQAVKDSQAGTTGGASGDAKSTGRGKRPAGYSRHDKAHQDVYAMDVDGEATSSLTRKRKNDGRRA